MKMKIFFVLAAVISGNQLLAQKDTTVLDAAIVTANRFEEKQSATGKVVTVIDREKINKSQGKTLTQLLEEQAGLVINGADNAPGSVQTVYLRGAASGRTLILLDGVPVNDPSMINNEFDLNVISLAEVERIEICKGAQSTIYGSDAIAGVINIITTKKNVNKPFNARFVSSIGNRSDTRNGIQLYGRSGRLTYSARFNRRTTDGFSSAYDSTHAASFDNDGYTGNIFHVELGYAISPAWKVTAFARNSDYRAGIDAGIFTDEKDYHVHNDNFISGLGTEYRKGRLGLTANFQYGEMKRNYENDSAFVNPGGTIYEINRYRAKSMYGEIYANYVLTPWLRILAGGDYRKGSMRQEYHSISGFGPYDSDFPDSATHQVSGYATLVMTALQKKLSVDVGGRINSHSVYGTNATYSLNPSYLISSKWRVFGSIATGYKAPSVYQVYDAFSGNPDLDPEKSTGIEAGVQHSSRLVTGRAVYFHRKTLNGIDFNYVTYKYFNFIRQTVNGMELELSVRPVKTLTLTANYTLVSGKELSNSRKTFNDTTYDYFLRRPRNTVNLDVAAQITPKLFADVHARYAGKHYDVGGYAVDDVALPAYWLIDAYAEYRWTAKCKFFADLQNATDKKFFDQRGYTSIPRLFSVGFIIDL